MRIIRLCTQIRNSAHCLDRWWNGLLNLNYPKNHIKLDVIEDFSEDDTYRMLKDYQLNSPFKKFTVKQPTDFPDWFKLRAPTRQGASLWCFQEWLNYYNLYWFPNCTDKEWFLCIHSDVVCHPETINRHLEIMDGYPDCGWVGSLGMARGGEFSVVWGWKTSLKEAVGVYAERVKTTPKEALFIAGSIGRVLKLNELPKDDVFTCALSASCFSIRPTVLKLGCRMSKWGEEAALGMAVEMAVKGYYAYCDRLTSFVHVNGDGSEEHLDGRRLVKEVEFRRPAVDKSAVEFKSPVESVVRHDVGGGDAYSELERMVYLLQHGQIQRCRWCNTENSGDSNREVVVNYWRAHCEIRHPEEYRKL